MRGLLFFAAVSVAFGQLDSDTFTITSSRTLNAVVDQVQVTVNVNSGTDAPWMMWCPRFRGRRSRPRIFPQYLLFRQSFSSHGRRSGRLL